MASRKRQQRENYRGYVLAHAEHGVNIEFPTLGTPNQHLHSVISIEAAKRWIDQREAKKFAEEEKRKLEGKFRHELALYKALVEDWDAVLAVLAEFGIEIVGEGVGWVAEVRGEKSEMVWDTVAEAFRDGLNMLLGGQTNGH